MEGQTEYRLTVREKMSYSFGDCAGQIYVTLATYFLIGYYTDTIGISAMAVGTMMLVARIFDGSTDLVMGAIIDRTKSKHGKTRAWILWTTPLMAIALVALFSVPESASDSGKLIYAYITYILLNCIIYTANGIAYNSLLARMTLNIQDRCAASSMRFVLGNLMALLINGITASLVMQIGWQKLVTIYAIVELVLLYACFFGCREHIDESKQGETDAKNERVPLKTAIPALGKNKYFFIQALMMVFLYMNIMTVASMTYYYCNTVLNNLAVMTIVTMAYNIPTILGSLVNPFFTAKIGKRKMLLICFALSIIGRIMVGMAGTNFAVLLVGVALHGLVLGPVYSNVFAMTPDIVDYGEWKTGIRSDGLVTCCVSFGMKVGLGIGGVLTTWVLTSGGYEGTAAVQTASAISAIRFGFGYLSAILSVICFILTFIMNLDKKMEKIQGELIEKHSRK